MIVGWISVVRVGGSSAVSSSPSLAQFLPTSPMQNLVAVVFYYGRNLNYFRTMRSNSRQWDLSIRPVL